MSYIVRTNEESNAAALRTVFNPHYRYEYAEKAGVGYWKVWHRDSPDSENWRLLHDHHPEAEESEESKERASRRATTRGRTRFSR